MEYFVFHDREMLVREDGSSLTQEDFEMIRISSPSFAHSILIGNNHSECEGEMREIFESKELGGFYVMEVERDIELPEGCKWVTIRSKFAELANEDETCFLLSRAKALLEWRKRTRYCSCCGTSLKEHESLTAMVCPECKTIVFPRIEPCIIVLVHRGDKILLARHVQRNQTIYACIAGFMEAGETAEHAVEREIFEETGIKVKNVKYFGSQSWPFPSQLMLAFTAEYESGELKLQEEELSDAGWFSRDNCPASPQPGSIAYRLIHES